MFDLTRWTIWAGTFGASLRAALYWAADHTGLPVLLVAAIALVASWHIFKRAARFAVQVVLLAAVLLAATKLGLLSW